MKLTYNDTKQKLHKDSMVESDTRPVGGHTLSEKIWVGRKFGIFDGFCKKPPD